MDKPKYQIGDRLHNTNFIVRGVMTDSKGHHRYFFQIFDNSIVLPEDELEMVMSIAIQCLLEK